MTYSIVTYGCQMNKSDSERIAAVLESVGFKPSPEEADLIVINICSVRQSAIDRAKSKIKNLSSPAPARHKVLLTGCILKKDKARFRKLCDGIFEIDKLAELPMPLKKIGFKIKEAPQKKIEHYLQITPQYQSDIVAYVPIMTGCNNFCAYCVVPYARGQEISRPAEEIICEVKNLVKKGVKEIWLLGQNVNSYKLPATSSPAARADLPAVATGSQAGGDFAKLLKMVNDVEGDFWLRFTSSHPKDLSDEMIQAFAKCEKATPYFNLPIQSGDDEVLKAMNRPYTVEKYKTLIEKARSAFKKYRQGLEKEIAISTDVIVGFPGETKKHFENTKKTFQEIGFAFAYISRYSPRPQTAASKLKDDVSSQEKKQREKELVKIVEKSALEFNKKFLNKIVDVLILKKKNDFYPVRDSDAAEGAQRECISNGVYLGKTRHHQSIKITTNETRTRCLIGEFVKAKVIKATPYGLKGKLVE